MKDEDLVMRLKQSLASVDGKITDDLSELWQTIADRARSPRLALIRGITVAGMDSPARDDLIEAHLGLSEFVWMADSISRLFKTRGNQARQICKGISA